MRLIVAITGTLITLFIGIASVGVMAGDADPSTAAGEDANALLDSFFEISFGLGSELTIILVAAFIVGVLGILLAAATAAGGGR